MRNYLYETHMHTSQSSPCGLVEGSLAALKYYYGEYDGIVITDHMRSDVLASYAGNWQNKIDHYLSGYRAAREQGEKIGLSVILGMEVTFDCELWDYLVYGVDESFIYSTENLPSMDPFTFRKLAEQEGLIMVSAHPFRYGAPPPVAMLDGVEVFNGNPRSDSRNHLAEKWCLEHRLFPTAGSDYHREGDMIAGIYLCSKPNSSREFADAIKNERIGSIMGARLDANDFDYAISW